MEVNKNKLAILSFCDLTIEPTLLGEKNWLKQTKKEKKNNDNALEAVGPYRKLLLR